MGGLSIFARQVGLRQHGVNSLVLHNPNVPWDIGFQLSFMATLGLVLYDRKKMLLRSNSQARKRPPAPASTHALHPTLPQIALRLIPCAATLSCFHTQVDPQDQ